MPLHPGSFRSRSTNLSIDKYKRSVALIHYFFE